MKGKTSFCGMKDTNDDYTKSELVEIDFLTDNETTIYEFESYISVIYLNNDNTSFCFEIYPKVS